MFYALLIVLVSFLIVDSIISSHIVKGMEKYKKNLFDEVGASLKLMRNRIFEAEVRLSDHINKTKRRYKKREVKKTQNLIVESPKGEEIKKKNEERK